MPPDLEIGLMSMALGEVCDLNWQGEDDDDRHYVDAVFVRLFIKKLDVYVVDTRQRRERRCIWTRKIRLNRMYS